MVTERIDTVVIGAGQAGLAAGFYLAQQGRPFVILDACDHVGDSWRGRWDSLRLFTPARYAALPGSRYPGSAWAFPARDEFADYLERYAVEHGLPVRTGTTVRRLGREGAGYVVETDGGRLLADHVVVAGARMPAWEPIVVPAGATVCVPAPQVGRRTYLAVNGTLAADRILGSVAPDHLLGIGRRLRAGDTVEVASAVRTADSTQSSPEYPGFLGWNTMSGRSTK